MLYGKWVQAFISVCKTGLGVLVIQGKENSKANRRQKPNKQVLDLEELSTNSGVESGYE